MGKLRFFLDLLKFRIFHRRSAEADAGMASPAAQPGPVAPQAALPPPPPPAEVQPGPIAPQEPPPPAALSDDILREIFVRIPCPDDLARTAISCASFRRVVTEPSFIRRFRALNHKQLLGVLDNNGDFFPAEPPHPLAPVARTVARGIDFSCSFLPTPHLWRRRDVRDGRFLLTRFEQSTGNSVFMELAVCDPLSRRYVLLPPVPDDLSTSAQMQNLVDLRPFFAPAGDDEADTSFKVIYMVRCVAKLLVFTFSSDAEQWNVLAYHGWGGLVTGTPTWCTALSERHYVHGCICWFLRWNQKLLLLDARKMEFSIINLPTNDLAEMEQVAIVEQPEGPEPVVIGEATAIALGLSYRPVCWLPTILDTTKYMKWHFSASSFWCQRSEHDDCGISAGLNPVALSVKQVLGRNHEANMKGIRHSYKWTKSFAIDEMDFYLGFQMATGKSSRFDGGNSWDEITCFLRPFLLPCISIGEWKCKMVKMVLQFCWLDVLRPSSHNRFF
ncbi:hypothetical protein GUJ93_ZPchr0013g34076 [Zizania palustris]|uniref:F-box domain-containing protein n=1 Tax=Zizania palustris TaxID=103762 RepID=A0A8J5X1D8_ZIZPA|nr:hypothetical protein GUJ93_ZPchr0013g34076 [Zizania palustris]